MDICLSIGLYFFSTTKLRTDRVQFLSFAINTQEIHTLFSSFKSSFAVKILDQASFDKKCKIFLGYGMGNVDIIHYLRKANPVPISTLKDLGYYLIFIPILHSITFYTTLSNKNVVD